MVPTTNVKISDIRNELGLVSAKRFSQLFDGTKINPHGINPTYCPGNDITERFETLTTAPFQVGHFRGYTHGMVLIHTQNGKLYRYDHDANILTYVSQLQAGAVDIALWNDKLWFLHGANPMTVSEYSFGIYDSTPTFIRAFQVPVNSANGMAAVASNLLLIGGVNGMRVINISNSPATVQREFDVDGSISTTLLYYQYTPTQPSIVGYVQKTGINDRCMEWDYNFTPYAILKELYLASCQGLYAWRRKVYAIYNGHLQWVNLSNLQHNYLLTISGNDSPITCATSTPFGNSHA